MDGAKIRRRPRWRIWLPRLWLTIVSLFLLWQIVTYRGVAALAGEWQFNTIGSYHPAVTFLGLLLLFSLPLLLLRLVGRKACKDAASPEAIAVEPAARMPQTLAAASRLLATVLGAAALALIATLVMLALMLLLPSASGPPTNVFVGAEAAPPTGPVALTGHMLATKVAVFNEDFVIARRSNRFAPIIAPDADETALRYFVELPPDGVPSAQDGTTQRTGVLRKGGLPGEVVQLYRYAGYRVDPNYYVLFTNGAAMRRPYLTEALELFVLAAFLALIGGLLRIGDAGCAAVKDLALRSSRHLTRW